MPVIPGYRVIHGYYEPFDLLPLLSHVSEAYCTPAYHQPVISHPVLEICYVHHGRAQRMIGDRHVQVGPGDILIHRPGEPHSARIAPDDPYHFFAIGFDHHQLPLPFAHLWASLDRPGASHPEDDIPMPAPAVIAGGQGLERIFRRILLELDRHDGDERSRKLSAVQIMSLLMEMLVFVSRTALIQTSKTPLSPSAKAPAREEFQHLLQWLNARISDPPSLDEMASRLGLSPSHFTLAFKREVGRTPIEHMTTLRIDEASRRLVSQPDHTITDIAMDLGFSSSQYFSNVFKKMKGFSPRQWRESAQ
jgi:AraC-like DNA-binding protein